MRRAAGHPHKVGPDDSSRGTTALLDAHIKRRVIVVLAAAQAIAGIGIGTAVCSTCSAAGAVPGYLAK
jgi:hypothetical protein